MPCRLRQTVSQRPRQMECTAVFKTANHDVERITIGESDNSFINGERMAGAALTLPLARPVHKGFATAPACGMGHSGQRRLAGGTKQMVLSDGLPA